MRASTFLIGLVCATSIVDASWAKAGRKGGIENQSSITLEAVLPASDNEVALNVRFESLVPLRIYSWRGHLYPLLGKAVQMDVVDDSGRRLRTGRVEAFLPEFPHKADVLEMTEYAYSHPLRVRVIRGTGVHHPIGCFTISMTYDTRDPLYVKAGLSPVKVLSNRLKVCPGPTPRDAGPG